MSKLFLRRAAPFLFALAAGCAAATIPVVPEIAPGRLAGYLAVEALPNSLTLLPPPPDSDGFAADEARYRATRHYQGTPRWDMARNDANLTFPGAADTFSCALDVPINPEVTPRLVTLMNRALTDAGRATAAAKDHYQRKRPFQSPTGGATCTPEEEQRLSTNGSYPSGHSSAGWAWALILAELAPDRSNAVLKRGYDFSESRVVCGVHWQSDIAAGRVVASATVSQLHTSPEFTADMKVAKAEIDAARAKGLKPTRDCAAEAAALALP